VKRFYVYLHRKQTDNSIFYVGKGTGKRAWKTSGRNSKWNRIVSKYGFTVDIVFDDLDEETAFACEKDAILELRSFGYDLCNMTDGGEGATGRKLTNQQKQHLSDFQKKRVRSKEELDKFRQNSKLATRSQKWLEQNRVRQVGRKLKEETKKKMSEIQSRLKTASDKHTYIFFKENDMFVGTRSEFSDYSSLPLKKIKPLFQSKYALVCQGWSVLRFNELILLKEILK
jgi:hypothetical protein